MIQSGCSPQCKIEKIIENILFYYFQDIVHQRRVRLLEREHERNTVKPSSSPVSKFFGVLLEPTVYKPFCILTMCFFFQQMSGIYIFIFYTVEFFKVSSKYLIFYVLLYFPKKKSRDYLF